MKKGDCVHMRSPGNPISHLWIIVSDVDPITHKCVIVNVTTLGHICDKTVILHAGDHPSIEHDSVIRYQDAFITTDNAIEAAIRGGVAYPKAACSPVMLAKVVEGIKKCPETPFGVQEFCGIPTSTALVPPPVAKKKTK